MFSVSERCLYAYQKRFVRSESLLIFCVEILSHKRVKFIALLAPCSRYFNWSPSLIDFITTTTTTTTPIIFAHS